MRYILVVLGIVATLLLLIVVVGWSLPVKHHASREVTLPIQSSAVFSMLTDVDRFPAWRKSVRSVEHVADSGGRPRYREIGSNGSILYEIESSRPNEQLTTRIADRSLPFGGRWTYDIVPRGDSTTLRITEDGEVYNPIFRFVSRFVMGHTATIDQYLADVTAKVGVGVREP